MPFIEALRQLSFSVGQEKGIQISTCISCIRARKFLPHSFEPCTCTGCCRRATFIGKYKAEAFTVLPCTGRSFHTLLKQLDLVSVATPPDLQEWTKRAETFDNLSNSVRIAMVGKYIGLTDSYLPVVKALLHACIACSLKPSGDWIAASDLEDNSAKLTPKAHAAAWDTLRLIAI